MNTLQIGSRVIGPGAPCYLITEVGTTCLGRLDYALALIAAAAEAGMDAVKFQMIDPEQLSDDSVTYKVRAGGQVHELNMKQMFSRLGFSFDEWATIRDACRARGMDFFATVDFEAGVDLLDRLGAPLHKMGAWDITCRPLVEKIAASGKPLMVDLGPATEAEMAELQTWAGDTPVLYLHDFHTGDDREMNLRTVSYLLDTQAWPSGFSSPARDDDLDFLALALGARLLEKRLILSRDEIAFHADESLEPGELKQWVARIRHAERALGVPAIRPSQVDLANSKLYYRSLCTLRDVAAGEVFDAGNLGTKRPGSGLHPRDLKSWWGRRATRDLPVNTLICAEDGE
jgi:sialic acid synthase SpsE